MKPTTTSNIPEDSGQNTTDKLKSEASKASEQIKTGAQGVADAVSSKAAGYANQAKETTAEEVKSVASALRSAAEDLRSGSPQERTISQIAESLADASDAVRNKDLSEMVGDLNRFAKKNPLVFLGGAVLVGFAATRFAKATSDSRQHRNSPQSGYRTSAATGSTGGLSATETSPMPARRTTMGENL